MTEITDRTPFTVVRDPFGTITGPSPEVSEDSSPVSAEFEIPDFEGQSVKMTKAKLTSAANLEIDDKVLRLDDMVTLLVQCRVLGIDHKVDATSGDLHRVHMLKAIDSQILAGADFEVLKNELA